MTKQELIKKAYLELFKENDSEKEKRFAAIEKWIDQHGWFSGVLHNVSEELLDKSGHEVRPKSISGIEDNNGWIKIKDENDLPKENIDCFYIIETPEHYINSGKKINIGRFIYEKNLMSQQENYFTIDNFFYHRYPRVTHYKPIKKQKLPLY